MTVLSKYVSIVDCREFVHGFEPSCLKASLIALQVSSKNSISIYGVLYLISALLRGRGLKYYLTRLPIEVAQSSAFLATNCFLFLGAFCTSRRIFGNINYWGTLLAIIPACFVSILIERKQRRGILALYLTNLAVETGFNMMVHRKWISKLPNGEVLLFAIASAIYAFLFKTKQLDGNIYKLIKKFIGDSETLETDHHSKLNRKSRIMVCYGFLTDIINKTLQICNKFTNTLNTGSQNSFINIMKCIELKAEIFLDNLSKSTFCKHTACNHRYSCLIYPILGFIQRFSVGYIMQAVIKTLGSLGAILKNPKILLKIFMNPVNKQLGMFLGLYVFIFRAVSCMYRWLTNKNKKISGLIAGFFAGWSMVYYKSSSIALYLNFKLLEVLWMLGVANKKLPLIKSFDAILYALSTGFVLWVAVFEPHNIRYSYWKFMVKISDERLRQVDRFALDSFGTDASLLDRLGKA